MTTLSTINVECKHCKQLFDSSIERQRSQKYKNTCRSCIESIKANLRHQFDFLTLTIDYDNCSVYDSHGRKLGTKRKFTTYCINCKEQYAAAICYEKVKKHKWHCKSCSISKEWNENSEYRKVHEEQLKIALSSQEQKDKISELSKRNWKDPEIRAKMLDESKRDRKKSIAKGIQTRIANLISGKTKLKVSHGKRCLYKSKYMRSTFEKRFAEYLDSQNFKWEYEPKSFVVCTEKTYTPDFFVHSLGYVEIKGWWRDDAKEKYDWFVSNYDERIVLIMNRELQQLERGEITLENLFN